MGPTLPREHISDKAMLVKVFALHACNFAGFDLMCVHLYDLQHNK